MNRPPNPPEGGLANRLNGMEELEKLMYYGAKPDTMEAARILRKNMTFHEKMLWEKLKLKQICGLRFRRQHPIDIFIADFYCHDARLVVEIDGEIHYQKKDYDDGRSAEMEKYFIKVIRFTNSEVENNMESVVKRIEYEVNRRIESPPWGI
ncbi:MAG: endonuclease domain-containing protein [Bacteroidia bacterium]|nr:endonuclease domain-containing protein [Bacteroidia bacterium]